MSIKRLTQPVTEPVTTADVKAQIGIPTADTAQDAVIERRITEARTWAEMFMGRTVMSSNWQIKLDAFPPEIQLLYPPVSAIVSLSYTDTNQVEQTLNGADYTLDTGSDYEAWILPAYGKDWPSALDTANAVTVVYTAGYASADAVPGPIKEAIMLTVGHWMNYQPGIEAGQTITRIPHAVEHLLMPYKVHIFG